LDGISQQPIARQHNRDMKIERDEALARAEAAEGASRWRHASCNRRAGTTSPPGDESSQRASPSAERRPACANPRLPTRRRSASLAIAEARARRRRDRGSTGTPHRNG
jgi:hypothetical protein